ncbi:paraquat-inducible protein A [Agarivorans sp. MS3-6]|uniref:paraquat-inducible protein A n=1 Tax=Agarivorans sp. TSD2052 TaxID=2937286 RepID=UPI00200F31FF|nr:paraquat-inducible protein A [Agarivorans sp. TSD2052]UPW20589.1 paraquat-inducible protein A [Agarivorans sp. TSD2052]
MYTSAKQVGLKLCRHCKLTMNQQETHCHRCHMAVHSRTPHSLQKCWAFIIAATIGLFPANLLPITVLSTRGAPQYETIMSGVISLIKDDMVGIAIVVFVASIVVPVMKLVGLAVILLSLHYRINLDNRQRIVIYRIIEIIGKWSMLDLFVLSIMIAVFERNNLVGVEAGPGATAFGVVVILTLFAAKSFDTRLIWDKELEQR